MVPLRCPETSVRNYHYSLYYNPEERSSLLCGRNLETRLSTGCLFHLYSPPCSLSHSLGHSLMAAFCTRLRVKFKREVIVRVGTVLLYFLPEVWQKRTSQTLYLSRYVVKGAMREMEDKILFRHVMLLSATYKLRLNITRPPLWSSGQSFWLQIQRSRVRFPALPDFSE